jgi:hypothetical protein
MKQEPIVMTINLALTALVAELAEGDVPDPLSQRFRLAFVWADLARLAGEPLPAHVAAALDEPTLAAPAHRETHREPAFDAA